jgi:cell division protein FtsN
MRSDYRERSFASKNKPRRQPIGMYAIWLVAFILFVFASGFAGGWFTCLYRIKKTATPKQATVTLPVTSPSTVQQPNLPAQIKGQQPPLTFYDTLPKGGKGVIGSGLNANLKEHSATAPPNIPSQPQTPPATTKPAPPAPPAVKPSPPVTPEKPALAQPDSERKFTVQVASLREKSEAEALRNKLAAKSMNPVIIVVNIPEKGVVYRVRAGRHMLQREAQELAAKLGSGAIVTPE